MSRDITMCHPELQELASRLISECEKSGLVLKLGECFRTAEEQDALYAQGRTKPGSIVTNAKGSSYQSMHQWGVAFDVIRNDGKGAYYDGDGWFARVGSIGKSLGLEWGGDWTSPVDKPHFQLKQWGSTASKLKALYGNVESFKKTWNEYTPADDEIIGETNIKINGRDIKIDSILKDGKNYIDVRGLENAGFSVGYNSATKLITLDNEISDVTLNNSAAKALNINGFNYVRLRDFASILGKEIIKNGNNITFE